MMEQTATTHQTQTVRATKTVCLLPPASEPPESVWSILDAMWRGVVIPHKLDEELLRHYAKKLDAALKQMEESHRREIDRIVLNKDFTDTMKFCHQAILTRNGPRKRPLVMTLDEAIEYTDSYAKRDEMPVGLAEWLRELRQYRNSDLGVIMGTLRRVELFLWNIEKHRYPKPNPGDECVACENFRKLRAEVNHALSLRKGSAKCTDGQHGNPDCRGCLEHCEDVRKGGAK